MFRGLFKKDNDEEEFFQTVDPIVEQRRKEKFSKPLLDAQDFEEPKKEVKEKKAKEILVRPEVEQKPKKNTYVYQMSEIISPMTGIARKNTTPKVAKGTQKFKKVKGKSDGLVPILSPFYGDFEKDDEVPKVEEDVVLESVAKKQAIEKTVEEPLPTVEDNLRNIAKIIEEEKNQLKIIEERTGEFKLDFHDKNDEVSLIDEIDDDMSLDDLMSHYENKFSD